LFLTVPLRGKDLTNKDLKNVNLSTSFGAPVIPTTSSKDLSIRENLSGVSEPQGTHLEAKKSTSSVVHIFV